MISHKLQSVKQNLNTVRYPTLMKKGFTITPLHK